MLGIKGAYTFTNEGLESVREFENFIKLIANNSTT